MENFDISTMVNLFIKYHDHNKIDLNTLCPFSFMALLWSLNNGWYQITGITEGGFKRAIYHDYDSCLEVINNFSQLRKKFIELYLQKI